jgi:antitoxin (DNA-binding transcriptional repressor) of toxin-antitoxin stability system
MIVGARALHQETAECLEACQDDRIVITRHGKPIAILSGVAGQDLEEVLTGSDPEIAERLQRQRSRPDRTLSHREFWKRLGV